MDQSKKDNEFVVNVQIFKDGNNHELKQVKVNTSQSSPESFYNMIKNDQTNAYKKLYPHSSIAVIILPSEIKTGK
jgi:hypothetical protein